MVQQQSFADSRQSLVRWGTNHFLCVVLLTGWMAKLHPASHPAASLQFDVFISAGGGRFVPEGESAINVSIYSQILCKHKLPLVILCNKWLYTTLSY